MKAKGGVSKLVTELRFWMNTPSKIVTLRLPMNGKWIFPSLILDETHAVLVDTGLPGQLEKIREELRRVGVAMEQLTHVVLTHQDLDHVGGACDLVHAVPGFVRVLAHPADRPYIEGERMRIKDSEVPSKPVRVDEPLIDGQVLRVCGNITVIHTPGHTPGHICLYHHRTKTLIAGDSLVAVGGALRGPNPAFTPDMDTAIESLSKLRSLDIETVICYHGGPVRTDVGQSIAALANPYGP